MCRGRVMVERGEGGKLKIGDRAQNHSLTLMIAITSKSNNANVIIDYMPSEIVLNKKVTKMLYCVELYPVYLEYEWAHKHLADTHTNYQSIEQKGTPNLIFLRSLSQSSESTIYNRSRTESKK